MKIKCFALILALITVMASLPTSALEMVDTVTTVVEVTPEQLPFEGEQAFAAAEARPYSTSYGESIYFDDFESYTVEGGLTLNASLAYVADGYTAKYSAISGSAIYDDSTDKAYSGSKMIKQTMTGTGSWATPYLNITTTNINKTGKYTMVGDFYNGPNSYIGRFSSGLNNTADTFVRTNITGGTIARSFELPFVSNGTTLTTNANTTHWNISPSGTAAANGGKELIYYIDNIEFFFKPARTATYNLDGGIGTFNSFTYYDYEAVTLPEAVPVKVGSTFVGWKASTSGKTYDAGATIPAEEIGKADSNLTITAVWQENEAAYDNLYGERLFFSNFEDIQENTIPAGVNLVNVAEGINATFSTGLDNSNDAKDIYVVSYNGSKMAKIQSVSGSWASPFVTVYSDNKAQGKYSLVADFFSDETDKASAKAAVVLNRSGSTQATISGGTIPAGGSYTNVCTYTNAENNLLYSFDWTVNGTSSAGAKFYVDNIALYFKPLRTASFNANGAEGTSPALTYYDYEELTLPENPYTMEGYNFVGWKLNLDGKTYEAGATLSADVIGKADEDLTLTAVWDEIIIRSYNEAYGESIFYDNFEKAELGSTITGAPCYIADGHTVKYVDNANISIAEYNGSRMAKFTKTEGQASWWGGPHLSIDVNLGTTGKYTIIADYYAPEGCAVTTDARITFNGNADNASVKAYSGNFNYVYSFVLSENKQRMAYVAGIANASSVYTPFHLDNIELFYKPTRTVTFNADGGEGDAPVLTYYDYENLTLPENPFTKEDYVFVGWKSSLDGEIYQAKATIPASAIGKADEDLTLTAVWCHKIIPSSYKENSIRINDPSGIRFKASVRSETKADEKTTEYGFLVTRASLLGSKSADYLTFEQSDIRYVSGVSYLNDGTAENNIDKIFAIDGENIIVTAVVYGIRETKEAYEEEIVVRPYIKYDGEILYGEPMSRSVVSVAKALRDSGYENLDEYGKEKVQKILTICEEDI